MVADVEQVIKNRRVRIPQREDQREGDDKIFWRRSGSENIQPWYESSKFEEKFKKTFLENQTGFHHRPKQEVIAHQQSFQR